MPVGRAGGRRTAMRRPGEKVLRIVNLVGSGVVQPAPSCGQGWQSARA